MSTTSASPAEAAGVAPRRAPLVWDAPTRIFHWLFAICFAGAYLTAESERWMPVHLTLGYTMAGLLAFRIAWGLFGTRYARFASFVRGPGHVAAYLRSLVEGRPQRHAGHNPAGGWAIVALLVLAALLTATGYAASDIVRAGWLEEAHEAVATAMLAMVGVHLAGVFVSSLLHRENLVASMITGRKPVPTDHGIGRAWRGVAAIMLVSVLGYWSMQWRGIDLPGLATATAQWRGHHGGDEHDDD